MKELVEYLEGHRREFSTPLDLRGTDFQLAVWEQLVVQIRFLFLFRVIVCSGNAVNGEVTEVGWR